MKQGDVGSGQGSSSQSAGESAYLLRLDDDDVLTHSPVRLIDKYDALRPQQTGMMMPLTTGEA